MYSMALETISYEIKKNHIINASFVVPDPWPLGVDKTGVSLILFLFFNSAESCL